MSYTKNTWANGDVITAAKLNHMEDGIEGAGSGYDAVIRLTHAESSADDSTTSLTPSIVSGTFDQLHDKISDGGYPLIMIEYYHPWGTQFMSQAGYVTYFSDVGLTIAVAGYWAMGNPSLRVIGYLSWADDDSIAWS